MNKNQRKIINILALVVIMVVVFNISILFNRTIKKGNDLQDNQNTKPIVANEIGLGVKESEENTYDSEKYTDLIINDLGSTKEEINFPSKVAFIIDDLGYETDVAKEIMELEFPVALSILPFLRYSEFLAEEGRKNNQEIILHLPMEPSNSLTDPGPGAIKSNMSEEEIRQAVRDCILNFPYILGVNNHMGSKVTENRRIMEIILEEIKESNLFFIDSMTTKDSVAYELAKEMGIKTATRSIFLDNENDMEYIKEQMLEVQKATLREGEVIAIGHNRINTFYVLKRMIPELIKAGIEIVPVSELVK